MPPEPQPWDRGLVGRKHGRSPSPAPPLAARAPPGQFRHGSGYYQVYAATPSPWKEEEGFQSPAGRYGGGRGVPRRASAGNASSWRRSQDLPPVTAPRSLAVPVATVSYARGPDVKGIVDGGRSKPVQWPRPCSMSSVMSSITAVDEAAVVERNDTPMSPLVSEEGTPRKKARLGWGRGLVQHEKKKVDGSPDTVAVDDKATKAITLSGCPSPESGLVQGSSSYLASVEDKDMKAITVAGSPSPQSGVVQDAISSLAAADDKSTKPIRPAGCPSLATLESASSISDPGVLEQKLCTKESSNDGSLPSDADGQGRYCSLDFSTKLDLLDPTGILNSQLADLVQHEDACFALNKLLLLKEDVAKDLEKIECEIDVFENDLKAPIGDGKIHPRQSLSLQATCSLEPCSQSVDVTLKTSLNLTIPKDRSLASSVALLGESPIHGNSPGHGVKVEDMSDVHVEIVSSKCKKLTYSANDSDQPRLAECLLENGTRLTAVDHYADVICLDAGSSNVYADHKSGPNVKVDNNLMDVIVASNKDASRKSSEVFDNHLSSGHPQYDVSISDYISSCRKNIEHVREKLSVRNNRGKFKERALGLQFRAFHHIWKEDMCLVRIRKNRPKSQRPLELCSQSSQSHRSSIRSRFMLPAGNLTLVPTSEIVNFTSKLLSDSQVKLYRKNLKMPALILDDMDKKYSRFISSNGFVEDPITLEKERVLINPWTEEEKNIFMDMLSTFGKNFTKISSFLAHKTTADCIEYYYKNHKSESFIYVKQQLDLQKELMFLRPNPDLATSPNKWNLEVNSASLDILGEASAVAARSTGKIRNQQKIGRRYFSCGYSLSLDWEGTVDNSSLENDIAAADVLAGISGGLSSEATCSTPADKMHNLIRGTPTPEVGNNSNEETCSDEDCGVLRHVDWTNDERSLLIRALSVYGKDFAWISRFVGTKSIEQCKIYYSKARRSLGLDLVHPGQGLGSDMNGERNDPGGACAPELCSTQSCSKMDVDIMQSVGTTSSERSIPDRCNLVHTETGRSSRQCEGNGTGSEEVEGKVDRLTPVSNDHRLAKEERIFPSERSVEEGDDAAFRHNESLQRVREAVDNIPKDAGHHAGSAAVNSTFTASAETVLSGSDKVVDVQEDNHRTSPVDSSTIKVESQQLVVPESAAVTIHQSQVHQDEYAGGSLHFIPDPNKSGDVSVSGREVMIYHRPATPNSQHQIPLEVLSLQNSPKIQSRQDNPTIFPFFDPSLIFYEDLKQVASPSVFSFAEQGNRQQNLVAAKDFYHAYLKGKPLLTRQPFHILRGYPLQLLNNKEVKRNGDHASQIPLMLDNILKENGFSQPNQLSPVRNSEKHSSVKVLLSQSESQLEPHLQPCSDNLSVETDVQSNRTGDFKLFGQILSHPSCQQNPSLPPQESDSRVVFPKRDTSLSRKRSICLKDMMPASRLGSCGPTNQAELPKRSYGFWDGNRIQTGYFSLPESSLMLTKYQGSLSAATFYPEKEDVHNSNGVLTDHQQAYAQTLTADGKRLKNSSEWQKRNVFETVSGFQHQGRAVLGINMVEGGGFSVGAHDAVSEPASALKVHYAGRANILRTKVESWSGDVEGKS